MTLKSSKISQRASDLLIKLYHFSYNYSYILTIIALIVIYIQKPEVRYIYLVAIEGILATLAVLVIITCPLLVLLVVLAPILWLSEKFHKEHSEKQE